MPGDGVDRHAGEIGQVREEGAVGHVLAERHPVHLLEGAHDVAPGAPGHDLVAEGGGRRGLGDADDERRAERGGQPTEQRGLRGAGQRAVEGHDVLGPQHEAGGGVGRGDPRRRRQLGLVDRRRRDLLLAQPALPPPWTRATRTVPTGEPPSGAAVPATTNATIPAATTTAPTTEGPVTRPPPPEPDHERGDGDTRRPTRRR